MKERRGEEERRGDVPKEPLLPSSPPFLSSPLPHLLSPLRRLRDTVLPRALLGAVPGAVGRGPARDASGRPLLYVTVDDGPDDAGTPLWLDALDDLGAGAVFFLSAERARAMPRRVRQIVAAGHRVGSHGDAHRSGWRRRPAEVRADFDRAERTLEDLAGAAVRDVRPPYGRVTPALVRWAREGGRRIVLWDVMPGDFVPTLGPDALARAVVADARPGSVVALHDGPPAGRAVAALGRALPTLGAAGWRFPVLP